MKNIPFTLVDGSDTTNKELKERLWSISGKRLLYPQVFFREPSTDSYTFFGDWHHVHVLTEHNEHTGEFDTAFEGVVAASGAQTTDPGFTEEDFADADDGDDDADAETEAVEAEAEAEAGTGTGKGTGADGGAASGGGAGAGAATLPPNGLMSPSGKAYTWERCVSSKGDVYWFHRGTGESSWVDPTRGAADAASLWLKQTDSKGRTYYYNR